MKKNRSIVGAELSILIIGEGGREHALAVAFSKSKYVQTVYVARGNAGIKMELKKIHCVDIESDEIPTLIQFAKDKKIDVTFVGPEKPLEMGIVDAFQKENLRIIGPTKAAARLESSKVFAKGVMEEAGIKTASYSVFHPGEWKEAETFLETQPVPIVVKESGLADGKGVTICFTLQEAKEASKFCLNSKQVTIVIEKYLEGPEFSHFTFVNENYLLPLGLVRDYKRAKDGDKGPNTSGLGAFSPVTEDDDKLSSQIVSEIVRPLAQVMVDRGTPFTGILYTGVMKTKEGINVIEFNVRLGDPEAQVLLPRIQNDWISIINHVILKIPYAISLLPKSSLGVVVIIKHNQTLNESDCSKLAQILPNKMKLYSGPLQKVGDEFLCKDDRAFLIHSLGESLFSNRMFVYQWLNMLDQNVFDFRIDIGKYS